MKVFAFLSAILVVTNAQFSSLGGFKNPVGSAASAAGKIPGVKEISSSLKQALEGQWNNFNSLRQYASEAEKAAAKNTFLANGAGVEGFNEQFKKGAVSFGQKLNDFADMAQAEFNKLMNGFKIDRSKLAGLPKGEAFQEAKAGVPEQVDWRAKGGVSPVKFQGLCASCYAFSSAGALEGQNFRKTGKLVELSPQNIMDCSKKFGNDGCDGGFTESSFTYVKDNKGIGTLSSYPYEAKGGECRYDPNAVGTECKGYGFVPPGSEKALEAAVATLGPIAVAIDASGDGFQFYKEGVYFNPKCGNKEEDLNHAVLVVGYGKTPSGQKYWLVKNSYGPKWGEEGYFKIAKDVGNHCGIATYARFPIV